MSHTLGFNLASDSVEKKSSPQQQSGSVETLKKLCCKLTKVDAVICRLGKNYRRPHRNNFKKPGTCLA